MKYIVFLILIFHNFSFATSKPNQADERVTSHLQVVDVECVKTDNGGGKLTVKTNQDLGGTFYIASLTTDVYWSIDYLCKTISILKSSEAYVTLRITNEKSPQAENDVVQAKLVSIDLAPFND